MYNLKSKEEIARFIVAEVINTSEVRAILNNCSRQYIGELVTKRKLIPIKTMVGDRLFFKLDVELFKKEASQK